MKRAMSAVLVLMMLFACAHAEAGYDVEAAIEALKTCWRDEVYAFAPEASDAYLEIKNTRLVLIRDELASGDEQALKLFGDVDCIVEFVLYSDVMGLAPYYQQAGNWQCVLIYKDGTMEAVMNHPFEEYCARTYSLDLSGIVEDVIDLNQAHNAVYNLLEE